MLATFLLTQCDRRQIHLGKLEHCTGTSCFHEASYLRVKSRSRHLLNLHADFKLAVLKKLAVDPEEYLSEEEEEGRIAQVSIPAAVTLSVGGTLPAQSSSTNLALAEPMHSPARKVLDVEEPSLVTGAVDPPLLSVEDVSGASEEENGEYLPEPEEVSSIPDTMPSEEDGELDCPVETSPDSVVQPQHAAEIPFAVLDSGGGGDLDVGEPGQSIRHSRWQRQPPMRLQYTGLGNPLISCCADTFP